MADFPRKVLVVDDDPVNRKVVETQLRYMGHDVVQAKCGEEALELLDATMDLALVDVLMPGMDGYETVVSIRESEFHYLPVIMITSLSDKQDRLKAVACGANDFITKPVDIVELGLRMSSLMRVKDYHDQIKRYQAGLESMVKVRTKALKVAVENLEESQKALQSAHLETLHCLAVAAEYKDDDTASHISRMSQYSRLLASQMGFSSEEVDLVYRASPMHDIGKIGIADAILLKPGKLTSQEWEVMKTHTLIGESILKSSNSVYLETGRVIAVSHHERFDGTGYPYGLKGHEIPVYGRICAISDVFDALTSPRPYKKAFSFEKSVDIVKESRGSHMDPEIVDIFLDNLDEVHRIYVKYGPEADS